MAATQIVFLASKPVGYLCFEKLIVAQKHFNFEIIAFLTPPKKGLNTAFNFIKLAQQFNIPVLKSLEELPICDIIYSIQYHEILNKEQLQKARKIAVNMHMAPLPEYRGCNQFSMALIDNKKVFGTTLHEMETGIDNGAILFEKRFPIPENCWIENLYQLTQDATVSLFEEALPALLKGDYKKIPQADLIAERGSSFHLRNEITVLKNIDLNWDKEKIQRHIRATFMPGFEPPFTMINKEKIYFNKIY